MKLTIPNVDEESKISNAWMTSMMPFLYVSKKDRMLMEKLLVNGYRFFDLKDESQQSAYYGDIHISNVALNQHFLPYIERRLFPNSVEDEAFHRFSKAFPKKGELVIYERHYLFQILSVDVMLCPFGIGFVTIRLKLEKDYSLSETLDFMHHFRILEPKALDERGVRLYISSFTFHTINDFIMQYLCPEIQPFIIHDEIRNGYYGSLPFFEDERMLVSAYIEVAEDQLPIEQLYRSSQLDGYTEKGIPLISAGNIEHMEEYLKTKINNRYMPKLCDITTEHVQTTIVFRQADDVLKKKGRIQFMGVNYYNVILHYFYKLTLLELSFRYSELMWKKDEIYVEKLMKQITLFSSKFYFQEVSSRSSSRETAKRLRSIFKIDELFGDVAKTLDALYVNQEKTADQRQNQLLFILTVFSVVSGIFGMNLVILEWKDYYNWTNVFQYSIYEWICLITAVAGIMMSAGLLLSTIFKWGLRKIQIKKWY